MFTVDVSGCTPPRVRDDIIVIPPQW